jgi:hypothetical protein
MASEPLTGALLRTLAASRPGGRLLELGTGTGLATAWLLDGMGHGSTLTSVDNDSLVQAVPLKRLGDDPRLQLINVNAIGFLGNQTPRKPWTYGSASSRRIKAWLPSHRQMQAWLPSHQHRTRDCLGSTRSWICLAG